MTKLECEGLRAMVQKLAAEWRASARQFRVDRDVGYPDAGYASGRNHGHDHAYQHCANQLEETFEELLR